MLWSLLADGLFLYHTTLNKEIGRICDLLIILIWLKLPLDTLNLIRTKHLRDTISKDDFKARIRIGKKMNWLVSCFDEAQFQLQHLKVNGWGQDFEWVVGNVDVQLVNKSTAAVWYYNVNVGQNLWGIPQSINLWLIKAAPNLEVNQGTDVNPYRCVHRVYLIKWTVSKYSTPLYKTDKVQAWSDYTKAHKQNRVWVSSINSNGANSYEVLSSKLVQGAKIPYK